MKVEAMLGLIMAMTAIRGAATQHVGIFMKDIEEDELAKLRSLYQANLFDLYGNRDVCRWIACNASCLVEESLKLAKYLCEKSIAKPYDLMQISLISEVPEDMAGYIRSCNLLLNTAKMQWIQECLTKHPNQTKVKFKEFNTLVLKLIASRWNEVLD